MDRTYSRIIRIIQNSVMIAVLLPFVASVCPPRLYGQADIIDGIATPTRVPGNTSISSLDVNGETVNLHTGGLSFFLPIHTLPQRVGAAPLTLGFRYSSNQLYLGLGTTVSVSGDFNSDTGEEPNVMVSYSADVSRMMYSGTGFDVNIPRLHEQIQYAGYVDTYGSMPSRIPVSCVSNFRFIDWNGDAHTFSITPNCSTSLKQFYQSRLPKKAYSDDGSMFYIDASSTSEIVVTDPHGTKYHFPATSFSNYNWYPFPKNDTYIYNTNGGSDEPNGTVSGMSPYPSTIIDRNGNQISIENGILTDTVGRKIIFGPSSFSFPDVNGTNQTVQVTKTGDYASGDDIYSTIPNAPNTYANRGDRLCSVVSPFLGGGYYDMDYVAPQGEYTLSFSSTSRKYIFDLDQYGALRKIVYPEGGYRRYDYQVINMSRDFGGASCRWDSPRVTTQYECSSSSGACSTETKNTYAFNTSRSSSMCQNAMYDNIEVNKSGTYSEVHCFGGLVGTKPILDSVETASYTIDNNDVTVARTLNTYGSGGGNTMFMGELPVATETTVQGRSSHREVSYNFINYVDIYGNTIAEYIRDNPNDVKEYDYDSSLLRETKLQWLYQAESLDLMNVRAITDSSGITQTSVINYDGYAHPVSTTATGTDAAAQHTTYSSTDGYYRPIVIKDGLEYSTTLSYDDAWVDSGSICAPPTDTKAYLSKVTNARSMSMLRQYNVCTGALAKITDYNEQVTIYSYDADALGRLNKISYPDKGWVQYGYSDVAPVSTSVTNAVGSTITTVLDGFGRETQTLTTDGTGAKIYADTTYDARGRVASVSTPYRSKNDSTYGVTQRYYDPLGRVIKEIKPGGDTEWWCYNNKPDALYAQPNCQNNVTDYASGAWVDHQDTNGHDWQYASDALGRIRSVVEPGSLTTNYGYDGLGNLISVEQKGSSGNISRTRTFSSTGLSQLVRASNVENGTICYGIWNGSKCVNGYDADSNLTAKTDARGVSTIYTYDNLNRVTSKTYMYGSSVDPFKTPITCYQYDTATNGIGRLGAKWTQPSGTTCTSAPISGQFLSLKSYLSYDAMGRLVSATQQHCVGTKCTAPAPYTLSFGYDMAGNMTSLTNSVGAQGAPLVLTHFYDAAGRPCLSTSNWASGFSPNLFQVDPTTGYTAFNALQNWSYGSNSQTAATGCDTSSSSINLKQGFDNRLRVTGFAATGQVR